MSTKDKRGTIEKKVDKLIGNAVNDNLTKGSVVDQYLDEKIDEIIAKLNKMIEEYLQPNGEVDKVIQRALGADNVKQLIEELLADGTKTDEYILKLIKHIERELQKWAESQAYILQLQRRPKKPVKSQLLPHAPAPMYLKF